MDHYLIISWNINRYDEHIHQFLKAYIEEHHPDIIFLSETKLKEERLIAYFQDLSDYNYIINVHEPFRYHGVAMLIRKNHSYIEYEIQLNIPVRKDTKDGNALSGRLIAILFNNEFIVLGVYNPNSGVATNYLNNLDYRINIWDPSIFNLLNQFKQDYPVIFMGDLNVAPTNLDVSKHFERRIAGYTDEERNSFNNFLNLGWIDIWRYQHPNERKYTWIGNNHGDKEKKNYGLRLDNIIITPNLVSKVSDSFIFDDIKVNSDHLPIGIYLSKNNN